jgi:hypothetical protein
METITRVNGNGKDYTKNLPLLVLIDGDKINDVAMKHILENTGLRFEVKAGRAEAQPQTAIQIAALLMTYNYKTRYYDNLTYKNTLMLKNDHHTGFDVDSICFDCCEANHINTNGLDKDSRLAC